jgi:hypothetical protein
LNDRIGLPRRESAQGCGSSSLQPAGKRIVETKQCDSTVSLGLPINTIFQMMVIPLNEKDFTKDNAKTSAGFFLHQDVSPFAELTFFSPTSYEGNFKTFEVSGK